MFEIEPVQPLRSCVRNLLENGSIREMPGLVKKESSAIFGFDCKFLFVGNNLNILRLKSELRKVGTERTLSKIS